MISKEQVIETCKRQFLNDTDMVAVIQRFIYDKKGYEIQIQRPMNNRHIQMMSSFYYICMEYYLC